MIEQQATVIRVEGSRFEVEIERKSACGHCTSQASCGTSVLGKWLGTKPNRIWLEHLFAVKRGDRVIIGIDDSVLLQASFATYLIPLLTMLTGSVAAASLGAADGIQAFFGFIGFVLGLMSLRWWVGHGKQKFQPQLIRPVSIQGLQVDMIQKQKDHGHE